MVRFQTIRLAVWFAAYAPPFTADCMAVWDFSTALEMTVASPDNQTVRFQTSDGGKEASKYMPSRSHTIRK